MKIYQILSIAAGDAAPPGVGFFIDGVLVDVFTSEQARQVADLFDVAADSVDALVAAGPPYPDGALRN